MRLGPYETRDLTKGGHMKFACAILFAVSVFGFRQALAAPEDEVRAGFDRFVAAQNEHDRAAVGELLLDSPNFLWITRGTPIWGREAALKRFDVLYQGTWRLSPDSPAMKITLLSDAAAQLYVPIIFNIGPAGQPAPDAPFLMNQTWVRTSSGWRIANILPIPVPTAAAPPAK